MPRSASPLPSLDALLRTPEAELLVAWFGRPAAATALRAELASRRTAWQPRRTDYNSGAIWKYAQLVGPAHLGAVTHPGAEAETHCYADI